MTKSEVYVLRHRAYLAWRNAQKSDTHGTLSKLTYELLREAAATSEEGQKEKYFDNLITLKETQVWPLMRLPENTRK